MGVGVKGIVNFGMGMTLREGDRAYYYEALDRHFPGLRIRYQNTYGNAYELSSPRDKKLLKLFTDTCRTAGILYKPKEVFEYINEFPFEKDYQQLSFF